MVKFLRIIVKKSTIRYVAIRHCGSTKIRAAVHMQSLSGNEAGVVGGQKHRGARDFFGAGHTPERYCTRHLDEFLFAAAITRLRRVGEPRRDRIDPDPVWRQFQRHCPRHRQHTALARDIMHAPWRAAKRRTRSQVDDRSRPPSRYHRLGDGLSAETRTFQIDVKNVIPVALAHVEERDPREYAGVVDQNVDPPELMLDNRDHRLHLPGLPHIRLEQQCTPPPTAYFLGDRVCSLLVIEPIDRDIGAGRSEFHSHSAADPLLRPCYQNYFAGAPHAAPLVAPSPRPSPRERGEGGCGVSPSPRKGGEREGPAPREGEELCLFRPRRLWGDARGTASPFRKRPRCGTMSVPEMACRRAGLRPAARPRQTPRIPRS